MPARLISPRFLTASVVLPALIVAADQVLIGMTQDRSWSALTTLAVLGWFVVQTGLLAYIAGRWLPNWRWRLLVLCWAQWLIIMLLPQVAPTESRWISISQLLFLAFLSGQIGALATWTVLGRWAWWRRLAIWLLAPVPLLHLLRWIGGWIDGRSSANPWDLIMSVQAVGTCVLAALLHVCGHRIEPAESQAAGNDAGPVQFSIRHLFIATTAVGITVPLVQGMLRESANFLSGRQMLHATADGIVLAAVSLAAIWATLGAGRWWIKVLAFAFFAIGSGAVLCWLEQTISHPWRLDPRLIIGLTDAGWWWIAWTSLAGSFLAANLLVLRATGYRLVRRRR